MGGQRFNMHPGSTKSLLLNLTLPGDTRVHILKLRRSKGSPLRQFVDERSHNINAAVSKLIDMCDVGNLFARLSRGPVRVVWTNEDGNRGRYVNDDAWMDEMADGASAEMMLIHRPDIFDLVFPRTKASDWYRAAFFDTLTLQGDRHGEQAFITEDGKVALIDTSHRAFSLVDGLNIVWSPGAYYFARNMFGWTYLTNNSKPPVFHHRKQLSWDIRCTHETKGVDSAAAGLRECADKIKSMSTSQIATDLFESPLFIAHSRALKHQANLLHRHGLEHTLRQTKHSNDSSLVPTKYGFPWLEPVCLVTFQDQVL